MPSKTGLQKNLRRYGLFLIIGLCITALIWGAMSAQLNTRALSFNEDAAPASASFWISRTAFTCKRAAVIG